MVALSCKLQCLILFGEIENVGLFPDMKAEHNFPVLGYGASAFFVLLLFLNQII